MCRYERATSHMSYHNNLDESQQVRQFFQPPPMWMRDFLISRVVRTGATTWFFYLGAKIFEQLNKRNRHAVARPFVHWINKCDEEVTNALNPNLSVEELEIHLFGLLELIFLKFVAINTQAGYSLLRRSVPVFIGLVSSDPSLLVERQGLLLISVTRALDFHRCEVKQFVFRDSMIAFALGTPSFVQYDTSDCSTIPFAVSPLEWAHGIPAEFVVCIVQVNAWRASNPGIPDANDWPALVLRTLTWMPKAMDLVGEASCQDSYKVVARLAVQETWRHAVLIYIYMGMCLFSSNDPQVQHSVKQIVQLMEVLSKSPLDVQLFLPYLTAGLAARYEHQRAAVRDKIASFFDTRIWILPGAEFIKVLDHLWHGAAVGGAPVTWDDYVYSRRAVLPIS
ncbi:hypothetical protein BDV93DRAFT_300265 [Ceratobasidium sp. AG-I]|nr:hypothetical protein BDV93DRAFT_300265 [Ceratobasidium sp. AG-I]